MMNRNLGIIYLLLVRNGRTAKELADHFGVVNRTIYRDIQWLCAQGVPLYTVKGKGIYIPQDFTLKYHNLNISARDELHEAATQYLASDTPRDPETVRRVHQLMGEEHEWALVDYTSGATQEEAVFTALRNSILQNRVVEFTYCGANMLRTVRTVEPFQLCFKTRSWYMYGHCRLRNQDRLFKLTRISTLRILGELYTLVPNPPLDTPFSGLDGSSRTVLYIDACLEYRVLDEFTDKEYQIQDNGDFIVTLCFRQDEWLKSYIQSFSPHVTIESPDWLRVEFTERLAAAYRRNKKRKFTF